MAHTDKRKLAIVIALSLALLVGCGPEAGRPRGAGYGTGADPGNHPPAAEMKPG